MKLLTMLVILCSASVLGGCSKDITASSIRHQMSNDLRTPGKTWVETDNQIGRTIVINKRAGNEDIMRFLLLDHPTRSLYAPTTAQ